MFEGISVREEAATLTNEAVYAEPIDDSSALLPAEEDKPGEQQAFDQNDAAVLRAEEIRQ